jgi:hypothetical protein
MMKATSARSVEADHVLDPVDACDRVVRARQESAAFVRIQLAGVRDKVVKNVLGNAEVGHVRWSR